MKTISAIVLAGVILVVLFDPLFYARWDQRSKDLVTAWVGGGKLSNRVVVFEIDDQSLARFGRWPWPRDRLSALLQEIRESGADTIVLDMMFPEPDSGLPSESSGPHPQSSPVPSYPGGTNDALLASTLHDARVVIGFHLRFPPSETGTKHCVLHPLRLALLETENTNGPAFFSASGALCSVDVLAQASLGSGFLNAAPDRDGILRRVPLVAEFQKNMYPSLALAAYMAYRRIDRVQLTTNSSGAVSLRLGDSIVPVDSRSNLLLRFRGMAATFPHFSATDLMSRGISERVFQGKIVVVGVSAAGLRDEVATPLNPSFPGYEVHATAIDNLIQNDSVRMPRAALAGELVLLVLMGVGSGVLMSRFPMVWATPLVILLITALWGGSALLLAKTPIIFSPFPGTLVLLGNLTLLNVWKVSTEKRREEEQLRITRKFILDFYIRVTGVRDVETGAHVVRLQRYSRLLADTLASHREFRRVLTPKTIQLIHDLVPIHDIGKVGIPGHILRKPGPLTPEEFEVMKTHVMRGYDAFSDAVRSSGIKDEVALRLAGNIILYHHERWDGSGYPNGVSGNNIPVEGRIVAIADVYDALVSQRHYREPLSHQTALEYISNNRGTRFDPKVVDAFIQVGEAIQRIRSSCEDAVSETDPSLEEKGFARD
jgi:adenylate cyclase